MEGGENGGYVSYNEILVSDSSLPISRALLLHRVMNGVLLFMLTVVVGASFYGGLEGRGGRFWGVWWKISHLVVLFSLVMALKQYKVMLFRLSIAIQIVWAIISLTLLMVIIIDGKEGKEVKTGGDGGYVEGPEGGFIEGPEGGFIEGPEGGFIEGPDKTGGVGRSPAMAARILSPILLLWILIQSLIILSGFIVLKEPIRPKSLSSRAGRRRGNTEFEFGIWSEENDDDDEEGKRNRFEGLDGSKGDDSNGSKGDYSNGSKGDDSNGSKGDDSNGPKGDDSNGSKGDDSNLDDDDDDDDGLSSSLSSSPHLSYSPFNLYASLSSPTGFSRYLPLILQTLSILQAILWPLYFVDVVAALIRDAHLEDWKTGVLVGLTVTYHYSMMIWMIASLIISFQFRDKTRTWFASIISIAYLLFCFTIAIIKLAMWHNDFYSPIFTVIHICILAPWTISAYYIGTNFFDYSLVPTCCCCCTHAPVSSS